MTSVVSLTLLMAVSSNGLHYLDPDYYEAENIGQDCHSTEYHYCPEFTECFNGVCDRAVILAKKGATDCSGSFDVEGIANWTECRSSGRNAQEFGKYRYHDWKHEIKPTADRPKGCYAQNRNMYWNGHRTGGKSSGSSPVCKRVIGCRCKDIVNAEGEGRCNGIRTYLEDQASEDQPFCYVQFPSSCPDLKYSYLRKIRNSSGVFDYNSRLAISHVACEEDIPECNIKIGYGLDGSKSYYLEGYAGSAQNCFQIVKLREPSANGITWHSESKKCYAVFRATKFEKSSYSTTQSCIIGNKNCYTKEGHTCVFPFKYGGKEYTSCYSGHGGYWCPYSVTNDGTYNDWDWCNIDNCSETNQK